MNLEKHYENTIVSLSLLLIITIFGALLSLNRLSGIPFDFKFIRIFLEHFITGIFFPVISLFIIHFFINTFFPQQKGFFKISKKINMIILIIGSVLVFSFEVWFQFFNKFNSQSYLQMIYFTLGLIVLWVYIIKMKLFES